MLKKNKFQFGLLAVFAVIVLQLPALAETWSTETAGVCSTLPGDIDLAVDSQGYVHIAYTSNSQAIYKTNKSGSWTSTVVESNHVDYDIALALDVNDDVHIAYCRWEVSYLGEERLLYATNASGSWQRQDVTSHYYFLSDVAIGVTTAGTVYIAYSKTDTLGGSMDLYIASGYWDNWDSVLQGGKAFDCDIAIDSDDNVHLTYAKEGTHVYYRTNSSGSWVYSLVSHDYDKVVGDTSIAVDAEATVHISFYEANDAPFDAILKYANNDSGSWAIETVDNSLNTGYYTSIAATAEGAVRISYYDIFTKHLKYARNDLGSWYTQTVADANDCQTSIALGPDYDVHIGFRRLWSHVEHAYASPKTPLTPSNCNATLLLGQIHVTWQDNSSNENGFTLYYRQDPGLPGWFTVNLGPNVKSYQLHSPGSGTYLFKVRAYNSYGYSPYSNTDSVYIGLLLYWISIQSPDGGEILPAGHVHNITWTNGNNPPSTVTIDYSTDGGNNWRTPPIASSVANSGSYQWNVPFTESDNCIVRVRDSADGYPYDLSYDPFTILVDDINIILADSNANAWFGGDDRPGWTRNIGDGQSIKLGRSARITNAAFKFDEGFDYYYNPEGHGHDVNLVLNVRADNGTVIASKTKFVSSSFNGGWVTFPISVDLAAMREYIFTCYMPDGQIIKLSSSICGRNDNPWPYSTGYHAALTSPPYDMEDWNNWEVHSWDFNFWIRGYYTDLLIVDFDRNHWVDLYDLYTFVMQWLNNDCMLPTWCNKTDTDYDGSVDFRDFADLGTYWRTENYGSFDACDISAMAGEMSNADIYGSDGSDFWPGTWFIYETSDSRYGKMIVEALDKTQNNKLTLGWTTYNSDGSVYSRGTELVVRGTYLYDLDEGLETSTGADFQWHIVSSTVRYLDPRNGALFKLMYRAPE